MMDVWNEISGCIDSITLDELLNFDCSLESYEDLQSRYTKLHETYLKEIENSKKVKKNLEKCLKYYSKLCKKFEAQEKIIESLEKNIKEKMSCLEESYKTQEKLQGLIGVYKTERSLYSGEPNYHDLKREKEILLDLCCQLISESVKTNKTRNITNLILRKFRKDLTNEKLNLLRGRHTMKKEDCKMNEPFGILQGIQPIKLLNNALLEKFNEKEKDIFEIKEEINPSPPPCAHVHQSEEFLNNTQCFKDNAKETSDKTPENSLLNNLPPNPEDRTVNSSDLLTTQCPKEQDKDYGKEANTNESSAINKSDFNEEEGSFCLPSLETSVEVISQSEEDHVSFSESISFKQLNKNCDTLVNDRITTVNSDQSELNPSVSVPSSNSNLQEFNSNKEGTLSKNVLHVTSKESLLFNSIDLGAKKKEIEEKGVLRDECRRNNLLNEKVQVQDISVLNNKDCDSKQSKILPDLNAEKLESKISQSKVPEIRPSIFDFPTEDIPTKEVENLNRNESFELSFGNKSEEELYSNLLLKEDELCKIFKEMTSVRLLSPIREVTGRKRLLSPGTKQDQNQTLKPSKDSSQLPISQTYSREKVEKTRSRFLSGIRTNKKIKLDKPEEKNDKVEMGTGFLDSILSAMSIQNKEMKANEFHEGYSLVKKYEKCALQSETRIQPAVSKLNNDIETQNLEEPNEGKRKSFEFDFRKNLEHSRAAEKILDKKLRTFVTATYSNEEEIDKSVKDCILVLRNNTDEAVARVIVSIVFENVDEKVEGKQERPVPALTKTQSNLIVLLSVLKTQYSGCYGIISLIWSKISDKLFQDVVHWPDDAVETACRFYVALCKQYNDVKGFWKFCLRSMEDMKQRCCLVVLAALQTWPDTLHRSPENNNILVLTAVNIILHMPKENKRKGFSRHEKKLLYLKQLLQDFYGFKVNDTIEKYAEKLMDSFFNDEPSTRKSVVLLAKCRDVAWTGKHILSRLLLKLKAFAMSETEHSKVSGLLFVLDKLVPKFIAKDEATKLISCFSEIISLQRLNHESEQEIIEMLLDMKQYPSAKKIIREWVPREQIDERLRSDIINAAAEGILREIGTNRESTETESNSPNSGRNKKRGKKFKGKKYKKKSKPKRKMCTMGGRVAAVDGCSV